MSLGTETSYNTLTMVCEVWRVARSAVYAVQARGESPGSGARSRSHG